MAKIADYFTKLLTGKLRLIIEYVMIGAIVGLCGICFTLWIKTSALEDDSKTQAQAITTLEIENKQNRNKIEQLKQIRENDSNTILHFVQTLKIIAEKDSQAANVLNHLENNDDQVKNYLNTPIPDSLRRLYQSEGL